MPSCALKTVQSRNHNQNLSASFPWFTALSGHGLAGILLQGSWLLGLTFFYGVTTPWTDWLFKAMARGVAGLTTAMIFEQTLSFPLNSLRRPLAGGWAAVWIVTHLVHFGLLGSGLSAAGITTIINFLEGLLLASFMTATLTAYRSVKDGTSRPALSGSTFWPWLIAYGAVILFYRLFVPDFGRLTPADVPLIVIFSMAGNLLVGLLGTGLTVQFASE